MLVAILTTCLVLFLFQRIIWLVVPGLLALMIYYCLRPLTERLVLRGVRHETAVTLIVGVLLLIPVGIALKSAPSLLAKVAHLQGALDHYLEGGQNLLRKTIQALEEAAPALKRANLGRQVDLQIQQFTDQFAEKYLGTITLGFLKWLPALFLAPYLTYFMLKDSIRLKKFLIQSIPNAFFEKSLLLFARLDESLRSFFQGLLVLTILDTLCLASGLFALGVSPALLLGLTAAILSWIPYLGSMAGGIMVVLVAATDFPDRPAIAYTCLALFLGVRLLDDFVFLPLTIGRKLHIHPLLSVLMFFLGATVAGGTGLVLALPVLGVVTVVSETVSQIVMDRHLALFRKWRGVNKERRPSQQRSDSRHVETARRSNSIDSRTQLPNDKAENINATEGRAWADKRILQENTQNGCPGPTEPRNDPWKEKHNESQKAKKNELRGQLHSG
jgi:predicted PurR-regulated permease PerM